MLNRQSRLLGEIIVFLISILSFSVSAQSNQVNWSAFSNGFGLSNSTNFGTTSSAGQSFAGLSSNNNNRITSGFLSASIDNFVPVELSSFVGSVNTNNVTLKWQTATEVNNSGFEVEKQVRSIEYGVGSNSKWKKVGFVKGKGTSSEMQNYSFIDKNLSVGIYNYRIKQVDFDGSYKYFKLTEDVEISAPIEFSLNQNYPNPFNPGTVISWQLPVSGYTLLKVYDILGNEVMTLVDEKKEAGYYETRFDGSALASGIYIYRLSSGNYISTKKMLMIK